MDKLHVYNESLKFLKMYSSFEDNANYIKIPFTFNCKTEELALLREKLRLDEIAGSGNDIEKVLNLLKWTQINLVFDGDLISERCFDNSDWFDIYNQVKKNRYKLNCRYMTFLFIQMLLALNFKARFVICLPVEIVSKERHCVTEVYLDDYNKWIIADATYGLIYFNKRGIPINLIEMRNHIISNERFRILAKTIENIDYIWKTWTSHIFRFQYYTYNGYDMFKSDNQKFIFLNPKDFLSYDEINRLDNLTIHYDNIRQFINK